jgi:hypothetical protein
VKAMQAKIGQLALENDFLEGALIKAGMLSAWRDNILSQGDLSTTVVFSGAERHRKLQINAFRDNLAVLVEKLRTAIGRK